MLWIQNLSGLHHFLLFFRYHVSPPFLGPYGGCRCLTGKVGGKDGLQAALWERPLSSAHYFYMITTSKRRVLGLRWMNT